MPECAVCGKKVEKARLCDECSREVKQKIDEMAEKYPSWFYQESERRIAR